MKFLDVDFQISLLVNPHQWERVCGAKDEATITVGFDYFITDVLRGTGFYQNTHMGIQLLQMVLMGLSTRGMPTRYLGKGSKRCRIASRRLSMRDLYLFWIRLGFGCNGSNPAFPGQFCSDDEPVVHSLESDKPKTGSIESIGGRGGEDERKSRWTSPMIP